MAVLLGVAAFLAASFIARIYRAATGVWVPGWIGGLSLLAIFAVFFVVALVIGAPAWWEAGFFVVVGLHVGAFTVLARTKLEGRWWQVWR